MAKVKRAGNWDELKLLAEMYQDAQDFRMSEANKVRSGTVEPFLLEGVTGLYEKAEHDLGLEMVRCYRATVPESIRTWQQNAPGVGEHGLARLLGATGHPLHAEPLYWTGEGSERQLVAGQPFDRTLGQWWSYCGYGDPSRRPRTKGITAQELAACGKPEAKKLTYLLSSGAVKAGIRKKEPITRFGVLYYEAKADYSDRGHSVDCVGGYAGTPVRFVKCKTGPGGAYAVAGDPFQPSHIDAIAYRKLSKEILRELWQAAHD